MVAQAVPMGLSRRPPHGPCCYQARCRCNRFASAVMSEGDMSEPMLPDCTGHTGQAKPSQGPGATLHKAIIVKRTSVQLNIANG